MKKLLALASIAILPMIVADVAMAQTLSYVDRSNPARSSSFSMRRSMALQNSRLARLRRHQFNAPGRQRASQVRALNNLRSSRLQTRDPGVRAQAYARKRSTALSSQRAAQRQLRNRSIINHDAGFDLVRRKARQRQNAARRHRNSNTPKPRALHWY